MEPIPYWLDRRQKHKELTRQGTDELINSWNFKCHTCGTQLGFQFIVFEEKDFCSDHCLNVYRQEKQKNE